MNEPLVMTFEEWVAEDPAYRDPSLWQRIEDADGYVRFVWKGPEKAA